ncbi:tol-pal system YbgF family protein, partial [Bacteroidota bacterium]
YLGFLDIVEEYSITKSANLAYYYSGISFLRLGQYEDAIEYLKQFESDDKMIAPVAYGAIGDAYMELEDMDDALIFYNKAVNVSENSFTTPIYLMKVAFVYKQMSNYNKALEAYKRIEKDFPNTSEGRQVSKYIAQVEVLIQE